MLHKQSDIPEKILKGIPVLLVAIVAPETDATRSQFQMLSRRLTTIRPAIGCHTVLGRTDNRVEYRLRIPHVTGKPEFTSPIISELEQSSLTFTERFET